MFYVCMILEYLDEVKYVFSTTVTLLSAAPTNHKTLLMTA